MGTYIKATLRLSLLLSIILILAGTSGCDSKNAGNTGPYTRPKNTQCLPWENYTFQKIIGLEPVYEHVPLSTPPLNMLQAPFNDDIWYLVLKGGKVLTFAVDENDTTAPSEMIDISGSVGPALFDLAFQPDFDDDEYIYLSYASSDMRTRVSRFEASSDGLTATPASEETVVDLLETNIKHMGASIEFGLDDYLYISLGDGGSDRDSYGNGQNKNTMFGSVLRLDVEDDLPYEIPGDNPFVGSAGLDEIYAYGFRNPWKISIDSLTGDLWVADVGEDNWEEISRVVAGGNYGWNIMEGFDCLDIAGCDKTGLIDPAVGYDHTAGHAVTGGFVYRGSNIPELYGSYIFGDFRTGRIWRLAEGASEMELLIETGRKIGGFGQSNDGELYVLDYDKAILKVVPAPETAVPQVPTSIKDTGCFQKKKPTAATESMVPYTVGQELWSDGALKKRWMAIPDNTTVEVDEDGDFTFPVGSVLAKQFYLDDTIVETRFLIRHDENTWTGYSYAWNEDGSDAEWLQGESAERTFNGKTWQYPSAADCLTCHTKGAGIALGPETIQLNTEYTYQDTPVNQLTMLSTIGYIEPAQDPNSLDSLQAIHSDATVEDRARSYLHANCSGCHRGSTGTAMNLKASVSFEEMYVCNAEPYGNLGINGGKLIVPGEPVSSVLFKRISTNTGIRMPPIGTKQLHNDAVTLIREWIEGMSGCP